MGRIPPPLAVYPLGFDYLQRNGVTGYIDLLPH